MSVFFFFKQKTADEMRISDWNSDVCSSDRADARIRKLSRGKKSLDDFAHAFFGGNDGQWKTQDTYAFDDVVATLEGVVEGDWATFLRDRLDGKAPLTGGIEASGWKLVYR